MGLQLENSTEASSTQDFMTFETWHGSVFHGCGSPICQPDKDSFCPATLPGYTSRA